MVLDIVSKWMANDDHFALFFFASLATLLEILRFTQTI